MIFLKLDFLTVWFEEVASALKMSKIIANWNTMEKDRKIIGDRAQLLLANEFQSQEETMNYSWENRIRSLNGCRAELWRLKVLNERSTLTIYFLFE